MADIKVRKWKVSEEEIEKQIAAAEERGEQEFKSQPHAESAEYDRESNTVWVYLTNGCTFGFPPALIKELRNASVRAISNITLSPLGNALHWEDLDAHYSIAGLLGGVFGTKAWMRELGRKGGRATSGAKSEAARKNGAKGGRPRKERYDHELEVVCDLCGDHGISKGPKILSAHLSLPGAMSLDKLENMVEYLYEPVERKNVSSIHVPTFSKSFIGKDVQILGSMN